MGVEIILLFHCCSDFFRGEVYPLFFDRCGKVILLYCRDLSPIPFNVEGGTEAAERLELVADFERYEINSMIRFSVFAGEDKYRSTVLDQVARINERRASKHFVTSTNTNRDASRKKGPPNIRTNPSYLIGLKSLSSSRCNQK